MCCEGGMGLCQLIGIVSIVQCLVSCAQSLTMFGNFEEVMSFAIAYAITLLFGCTHTPSQLTHTHTPSHTTHTVQKKRVPQFCRFDIEPKLDHHKRQAVRAYDYNIHDDIT